MNDVKELLTAIEQGATLLFYVEDEIGETWPLQVDQYGYYFFLPNLEDKIIPRLISCDFFTLIEVLEELKDCKCEIS